MALYPNLHMKIRNITKTSLWKAGQGFLAKIDYISKVEHICKKMALAFFDIRPTTHLVYTLPRALLTSSLFVKAHVVSARSLIVSTVEAAKTYLFDWYAALYTLHKIDFFVLNKIVWLASLSSIRPKNCFLGSGPEGVDDLCFHTYGEFSPPPSPPSPPSVRPSPPLEAQIPVSRLKSQPRGSHPSLEAQIPVSRLKS